MFGQDEPYMLCTILSLLVGSPHGLHRSVYERFQTRFIQKIHPPYTFLSFHSPPNEQLVPRRAHARVHHVFVRVPCDTTATRTQDRPSATRRPQPGPTQPRRLERTARPTDRRFR